MEKLYSKVIIKVPSDYITTQRDGSLLIKSPTTKKTYTKKSKIVEIPIINETTIEEPTTTQIKPKKKGKFEKGSDAAIAFMKMMREKRKLKTI